MIRQRPILHVLATLLSIVVFGLMLTAAGQLVIGGPFAQRVLAALPGGTARPELIPDAIGGARPIEPSAPIVSDRVGVDPPVVGFGRADVERETRDHELRASKLPEIRVSKQRISAAAVEPGETVEFAIEVTNSGSTPLTEVYVADSYAPAWLEFLDADPPPNQVDPEAGTVTWTDLESLISDSGLAVEGRLRIALRFRAKAAPPDGRPIVNRARAGARERNVSDGPAEDRVTIVTPATLCLGDLVFVEREQDGHYDAAQGDLGVADVALRLFADSDASGAWTPEDRELVSTRTDASGRYRFCGLSPGAYLVVVDPSNFDRGGPLALLVSSSLNGIDLIGDPNDDRDDDDNGSPTGARGLIASAAMRLSPRGAWPRSGRRRSLQQPHARLRLRACAARCQRAAAAGVAATGGSRRGAAGRSRRGAAARRGRRPAGQLGRHADDPARARLAVTDSRGSAPATDRSRPPALATRQPQVAPPAATRPGGPSARSARSAAPARATAARAAIRRSGRRRHRTGHRAHACGPG